MFTGQVKIVTCPAGQVQCLDILSPEGDISHLCCASKYGRSGHAHLLVGRVLNNELFPTCIV